uniref:RdRp n=1 Tax=viral metagenome TaxID=1070528 RepID=A0A2V0R937_9ZZZZ
MSQSEKKLREILIGLPIVPFASAELIHADSPGTFEELKQSLKELSPLTLYKFFFDGKTLHRLKDMYRLNPRFVKRTFQAKYRLERVGYVQCDLIRSICTERDNRLVLGIRSFLMAITIAVGRDRLSEHVQTLVQITEFIVGTALRETVDVSLNIVKKTTGAIGNVLSMNEIESSLFPQGWEDGTREILGDKPQELYDLVMSILGTCEQEPLDRVWYTSCLTQTRYLPPASGRTKTAKIVEYVSGLISTGMPVTEKEEPVRGEEFRIPHYLWNDDMSSIPKGFRAWRHLHYVKALELGKIVARDVALNVELKASRSEGKELYEYLKSSYHTSLSSSASVSYTREQGGKWNVLTNEFKEFMEETVDDVFSQDKNGNYVDHFGNQIARDEHGFYRIWEIAYLEEPLKGSYGDGIKPEYLEGETAFARGVDKRLGRLLLLWSKREHDRWKESMLEDPFSWDGFITGKVTIITEPGLKIRPVTSGEEWLNVFLSPAAHRLTQLLAQLPAAEVGLIDTAGLYRFSQNVSRAELKGYDIPEKISTSDMVAATDRAEHDVSFGLLKGIIEGLVDSELITRGERNYLIEACAVLCSPRRIKIRAGGAEAREIEHMLFKSGVKFDVTDKKQSGKGRSMRTISFISCRAILMGEPIAKVVLTASSYAAWKATKLGFSTLTDKNLKLRNPDKASESHSDVKHYCCAGDDHMGLGSAENLRKIPKFMESMGFEISWDKYRISDSIVSYCQEFGLHPNVNPIKNIAGPDGRVYTGNIHIDTPKLRLLSQFQKMGGKENFDNPDPLVGKAKALENSWSQMTEMLQLLKAQPQMLEDPQVQRYMNRIEEYGKLIPYAIRLNMPSWYELNVVKDPYAYIPTSFGGLGIPMVYEEIPLRTEVHQAMRAIEFKEAQGLKVDTTAKTLIKWERGLKCQVPTIDHLIKLDEENLEKAVLSKEEAFNKCKAELASKSDSQSIGGRRVAKKLYNEYTDVSRDVRIVSDKENAYVNITLGNAVKQTVPTRSRARQKLSRTRRDANAIISSGKVPEEYVAQFEMRNGIAVWTENGMTTSRMPKYAEFLKTSILQETFATALVTPDLKIPAKFFSLATKARPKRPVQMPLQEQIATVESTSVQTVIERSLERPDPEEIDLDESLTTITTNS